MSIYKDTYLVSFDTNDIQKIISCSQSVDDSLNELQ